MSKPGAIRGNHYHNRKTEWFCVVKGNASLILEDLDSGEKSEIILSGKDPQLVKIMPRTGHAIKNIGKESMHLLSLVSEVYNPLDPDTLPITVISATD